MTNARWPLRRRVVWGLVVLVSLLHYDFWFWTDRTVVFGFMPIGLLYQVIISLLAALVWVLVVRFDWPTRLEEWAGTDEVPSSEA